MPRKPGTLRYQPIAPVMRLPGAVRPLATCSRQWRAIRQRILVRDLYRCVDCAGYGDQVDHDDGDFTNNQDENLKTRCISCHSKKTAREDGGFGNRKRLSRESA